jgi:hypothetical protein
MAFHVDITTKNSHNLTYIVRLNAKSNNVQHQLFMTMVFPRDMSLLSYISYKQKMYSYTNHHENLKSIESVQAVVTNDIINANYNSLTGIHEAMVNLL